MAEAVGKAETTFSDCEPVEALLAAFGIGVAKTPEGVRLYDGDGCLG
jgi:hypothetical protein